MGNFMDAIKRFFNLSGEKASEIVTKMAELTPDQVYDKSYEQQLKALSDFQDAMVGVRAQKVKAKQEADELVKKAVKLKKDAEVAYKSGDEELARQALELFEGVHDKADQLVVRYQRLEENEATMTHNFKQMQTAVETFRTEKEFKKSEWVIGQATVAALEAQQGFGKLSGDIGLKMLKADEKISDTSARGEAMQQLLEEGTFDNKLDKTNPIERKLSVRTQQARIDAQLDEWKKALPEGEKAKALPEHTK